MKKKNSWFDKHMLKIVWFVPIVAIFMLVVGISTVFSDESGTAKIPYETMQQFYEDSIETKNGTIFSVERTTQEGGTYYPVTYDRSLVIFEDGSQIIYDFQHYGELKILEGKYVSIKSHLQIYQPGRFIISIKC